MTSNSIRRENSNSPQEGLCFNCETQDRGLVGLSREEEKAMEGQPLSICIFLFLCYQGSVGIRLQMYLANPRSDVGWATTNGEDVGGDFSKV